MFLWTVLGVINTTDQHGAVFVYLRKSRHVCLLKSTFIDVFAFYSQFKMVLCEMKIKRKIYKCYQQSILPVKRTYSIQSCLL